MKTLFTFFLLILGACTVEAAGCAPDSAFQMQTLKGDRQENLFLPVVNNVTKFSFTVYNRWGQDVFTTTTIGLPWDGRDSKQMLLPQGVYVYIVKYTDIVTGKEYTATGNLTLIH